MWLAVLISEESILKLDILASPKDDKDRTPQKSNTAFLKIRNLYGLWQKTETGFLLVNQYFFVNFG